MAKALCILPGLDLETFAFRQILLAPVSPPNQLLQMIEASCQSAPAPPLFCDVVLDQLRQVWPKGSWAGPPREKNQAEKYA